MSLANNESNKSYNIRNILLALVSSILALGLVYCGTYIWNLDRNHVIGIIVMSLLSIAIIAFYFIQEAIDNKLLFDNKDKIYRFIVCFLVSVIFSMFAPFLPVTAWIFPVLSIALMICSNRLISLITSTYLLILTLMYVNESIYIFILFYVCIVTILFAFDISSPKFKVFHLILIVTSTQLCMTTAMIIMFTTQKMSFEIFVVPLLNLVLSIVILLIVIKFFSSTMIYRDHSRYVILNDQEYELMQALKARDDKLYLNAIHISHLVEKISNELDLDNNLLKSISYYQNIDCLLEDNSKDELRKLLNTHRFPKNACISLVDIRELKQPTRKEDTAIFICNTIIKKIISMQENKNSNLNYDDIIESEFKKMLKDNKFINTEFTLKEINSIKIVLKNEGIYYDFLYR